MSKLHCIKTQVLLSANETQVDDGDDGHGEHDASDGDQESRNSVEVRAGAFDLLRVRPVEVSRAGELVDQRRVDVRRLNGEAAGHGVLQVARSLLARYFAENLKKKCCYFLELDSSLLRPRRI